MATARDVFSLSGTARENEISVLDREVQEAAEFKYDDVVLKSGSHEQTAKRLELFVANLEKLEQQIAVVQKKVHTSSFTARIDVLQRMQQKLARFSQLRQSMQLLNIDFAELDSSYRAHALKLLSLRATSHDIALAEDLPESSIMSQFASEVSLEIDRFKAYLYAIYDSFIMTSTSSASPNWALLSVNSEDPGLISDALDTLELLDALRPKLLEFTSFLWSSFCEVLLHSAEPQKRVQTQVDGHSAEFRCTSKPLKGEVQSPEELVRAFETLFKGLHDAFSSVQVRSSEVTFCRLVGGQISEKLIDALILKTCVSLGDDQQSSEMDHLKKLITGFDDMLRELDFVAATSESAADVLARSNKLFVRQRCRLLMAAARTLIAKPYVDVVEVTDEDEGAAYSITTPIQKLCSLLGDLLAQAARSADDEDALEYIETAAVVTETLVVSAPRLHQQALLAVPQTSALFYNNCHFVGARLRKILTDESLASRTEDKGAANILGLVERLNTTGKTFLDQQVESAKRQIALLLAEDDLFVNIEASPASRSRVERAMNACQMQLEQLRSVWVSVLRAADFREALGRVVAHLLALLVKAVLAREDLSVQDAEGLGRHLELVLARVLPLLSARGEQGIPAVCQFEFARLTEVVFCLDASLSEISDRWCNGAGLLAEFLQPFEVRGLVCALFQNTAKRAALLDEIKTR